MRRRFLWLAAAALVIGGVTLLYRGPGRAVVRGHLGDVGAAMLVYAIVGLARPAWATRVRVIVTLAFAAAMEVGQLAWAEHGRSGAGAIVLGSVFDPWDLVAYAMGVVIAVRATGDGAAMSFGKNPHVAKAEAAEQKAHDAQDESAREQGWLEAGRQWERAADREKDAKRRQLYNDRAAAARAAVDAPPE